MCKLEQPFKSWTATVPRIGHSAFLVEGCQDGNGFQPAIIIAPGAIVYEQTGGTEESYEYSHPGEQNHTHQ